MLVLSRRTNEEIVLPDLGVSIKVLKSSGNQVRLGISAPQDVRILRGELADANRWVEEDHLIPLNTELLHAM